MESSIAVFLARQFASEQLSTLLGIRQYCWLNKNALLAEIKTKSAPVVCWALSLFLSEGENETHSWLRMKRSQRQWCAERSLSLCEGGDKRVECRTDHRGQCITRKFYPLLPSFRERANLSTKYRKSLYDQPDWKWSGLKLASSTRPNWLELKRIWTSKQFKFTEQ